MNDTKCPTCGNADAYGYCDEAQVMTCVSCGYSEASDLRRQLTAIMHAIQRYQPAGSPIPGGNAILAEWTLSTMQDANERLRAQFAEVDTQLAERDALLDGRAGKLLRKGKHFVVVAEDEPYYPSVYACIRQAEKAKGSWTDVCEAEYQKHVHSGHFGDPRTMTLACQLADAQAILVRLADDALAISIVHRCCDPHHDGRWCATCDARNAGIEAYREALREKGDTDARHHTTD